MEYPVTVIAGLTCTFKSATAVELALMIGGEVVSADSAQVYRGMDIGTSKIAEAEMKGVPHHMIDVADPTDGSTVSSFTEKALRCIEDIRFRRRVPIIVGGTGFYIESLLFLQPDSEPGVDPEYRAKLKKKAENGGLKDLYDELSLRDPRYAVSVHPNNRMRIIRAMEYIHSTGRPYSEYAMDFNPEPRFPFRCFVFDDDRSELRERICSRVDRMMADGFEEEVRRLVSDGVQRDSVAMQAVGYRQMFDAVSGDLSVDQAVADIKTVTCQIAKRQLTWFRHREYAEWIDISRYRRDPKRLAEAIKKSLN